MQLLSRRMKAILLLLIRLLQAEGLTDAGVGNGSIAICMSGHVRSLTQRRVYDSVKRFLFQSLGPPNTVDLYMYLEMLEARAEAGVRLNSGWDTGNIIDDKELSSTSAPLETGVQEMISELRPFTLKFHNESKLSEKINCSYPSKHALPQLEKMSACFKLILKNEVSRGYRYHWIVRTRPDLGMLFPFPEAETFEPSFIFVSSAYWPMADQVRLFPISFLKFDCIS